MLPKIPTGITNEPLLNQEDIPLSYRDPKDMVYISTGKPMYAISHLLNSWDKEKASAMEAVAKANLQDERLPKLYIFEIDPLLVLFWNGPRLREGREKSLQEWIKAWLELEFPYFREIGRFMRDSSLFQQYPNLVFSMIQSCQIKTMDWYQPEFLDALKTLRAKHQDKKIFALSSNISECSDNKGILPIFSTLEESGVDLWSFSATSVVRLLLVDSTRTQMVQKDFLKQNCSPDKHFVFELKRNLPEIHKALVSARQTHTLSKAFFIALDKKDAKNIDAFLTGLAIKLEKSGLRKTISKIPEILAASIAENHFSGEKCPDSLKYIEEYKDHFMDAVRPAFLPQQRLALSKQPCKKTESFGGFAKGFLLPKAPSKTSKGPK